MANKMEVMVVLDDGETWATDGFVRVISDSDSYPDGDASEINKKDIICDIPISHLLNAYNRVHGTSY